MNDGENASGLKVAAGSSCLHRFTASGAGTNAGLARELDDAKTIQAVSSLLIKDGDGDRLYETILDAAISIMRADFGSMQVLNDQRSELHLIAWRNFHRASAAYWRKVSVKTGTTCGSALEHGERVIVPDVREADILRHSGSLKHYRLSGIVAVQSTPLTARDGRVIGMISTHWREAHTPNEAELRLLDILARQAADFIERTRKEAALRESELRAQTLLAELQHRVRNTLAVVRSIARRTADNSTSVDSMLAHFQGRLDAFSRVQAALTRKPDAGIDLTSLIEEEMVAHAARDGEQVQIDGPAVSLDAKTAERLSLAIHELATNAVKHGALTNGNGQVAISWKHHRTNGTH